MAARGEVLATVRMELEAGDAAVPELGKMLSPHGVQIFAIKREYDEQTAHLGGHVVPITVQVFQDGSWTLHIRRPTTASMIRAALGTNGRRTLSRQQLRAIAERKLPDLNTGDVDAAMRTIAGTARSMGVVVESS
jgi:large subunit ribosomal protein L11